MSEKDSLARLLDTEAIRSQIVLLSRYMDERRWDEYAALFTDQGVLELPVGTFEGAAAIRERIEADFVNYSATHYLSSNYDIQLNGDSAGARTTFIATHLIASDPGSYWQAGGAHHFQFSRVAGEWRISRMTIQPVWRHEKSATSGVPAP